MKKGDSKIIFLFLALVLAFGILPSISAIDIQLVKTEYYPGETIQADIFGSFSGGLTSGKIFLCRGNEVNPIAISSDLRQMNDKYLFYAITSSALTSGDYSLKIKSTTTQTCLSGVVFSKPLKIIATTNSPYVQVNPGFITSANNGEILLKIKGFVNIQKINANFVATSETKSFNLMDGTEKQMYFSISNLYGDIESSIDLGSYSVPVYLSLPPAPINKTLIVNETQNKTQNQTITEEIILSDEIKFSPESISFTVLNNTSYEINFSIVNLGNKTVTNLTLSSNSSEISLNKKSLAEISGYNTTVIIMSFELDSPTKTNINLTYKNQSIYLPISIDITKNSSEVDIETNVLEVSPERFDKDINFGEKYKFNFTIKNKANRTIEDITLSCDDDNIKLDKTEVSSIKTEKTTVIYFEVNTNKTIDTEIELTYENETIIIPINFKEYEDTYILSNNLIFYPENINGTFVSGRDYTFRIMLANVGDKVLEDIDIFSENENLKFRPTKIESLGIYKKEYINITINSNEDIDSYLIAQYSKYNISLPINAIITNNESEEEIELGDYTFKTCIELGGVTCKTGEICKGYLEVDSQLLNCCHGTCEKTSTSTKWIIGLIILVILGIIGFLIYSKYKNTKSLSSSEIMQNRRRDFEERMNPKQIRGGLSKN